MDPSGEDSLPVRPLSPDADLHDDIGRMRSVCNLDNGHKGGAQAVACVLI